MLLKLAIFAVALCTISAENSVEVEQCKKSPTQLVCASNGLSYKNICSFLHTREVLLYKTGERIKILKTGVCEAQGDENYPDHKICPRVPQPVCASNGLSYYNVCKFRHYRKIIFDQTGERIIIIKLGECLTTDPILDKITLKATFYKTSD